MSTLDQVLVYRDAAIADGWTIRPTYQNEPQDRMSSLQKDGFSLSIETRSETQNGIAGWGPDGLSLTIPPTYSMESLIKNLRYCHACGKHDVNTERYSFAGRCCNECLPAMRKKHEYPGWTN